ncbi:MAG: potassium channel family protein [Candidatus Binataceae bacterium]
MAEARDRGRPARQPHHPRLLKANNRFRILLTFLVLMLVVTPFFDTERYAMGAIRIVVSITLIGAVYGAGRRRRDLVIGGVLAAPSLVGRWLPAFADSVTVFVTVTSATALFLAFTAYVIIDEVARAETVTFDTIFGAGCGYLLIGSVWAFAYSIINIVNHPGFVFTNIVPLPPMPDMMQKSQLMPLVYFSFVTLTSTGFGDILPLAPTAKALAVCEAVIGQFYVAILVARLVSLEIISSHDRGSGRGSGASN